MQRGESNQAIVLYCLKILETTQSLSAKASIVWLMGQYFRYFPTISQDVLRGLVQGFAQEAEEVKLQILNFAGKLAAARIANDNAGRTHGIIAHLLTLAAFDRSYTVRQKARLLKSLISAEAKDQEPLGIRTQLLNLVLNQNLKSASGPGFRPPKEEAAREVLAGSQHIHALSFLVNRVSTHP